MSHHPVVNNIVTFLAKTYYNTWGTNTLFKDLGYSKHIIDKYLVYVNASYMGYSLYDMNIKVIKNVISINFIIVLSLFFYFSKAICKMAI